MTMVSDQLLAYSPTLFAALVLGVNSAAAYKEPAGRGTAAELFTPSAKACTEQALKAR